MTRNRDSGLGNSGFDIESELRIWNLEFGIWDSGSGFGIAFEKFGIRDRYSGPSLKKLGFRIEFGEFEDRDLGWS